MVRATIAVLASMTACGGSDLAMIDGGRDIPATDGAARLDARADAARGDSGSSTSVSLQIDPPSASVDLGAPFMFRALVLGTADRAVDWTLTGPGAVDENGLYTAPTTGGGAEVCATLRADPALSDCAAVTIVDLPDALELPLNRWTNITPAWSGGASAIAIDPSDPRTLYAAANNQGIWRTRDGGRTWLPLSEGPDPTPGSVDANWLDDASDIFVDPADPDHLYATNGVDGANMGFWVTFDGGVSWTRRSAPGATDDLTTMAVDPTDFDHVLVSSHSPWAGGTPAGLLETEDGGETWTLHPNGGWMSAGTVGISFLFDPESGVGTRNTWHIMSDGNGFFRTTNGGESWTRVSDIGGVHGCGELFYAGEGVWYSGGFGAPARSDDLGATWQSIGGPPLPISAYCSIVGDGNRLYAIGANDSPTFVSDEDDGRTWIEFPEDATRLPNGPVHSRFDAVNRIIYSANWGGGLWALRVP